MAELASVKVALLDIGKEQRKTEGKKNQTRHQLLQVPNAMRPVRQSGHLHPHADTIAAHPDPF